MTALVLFVGLCTAGIAYLLWFLAASDHVAARKLAVQHDEDVLRPPKHAKVP